MPDVNHFGVFSDKAATTNVVDWLKGLPASDQEWIFAKTAQSLYPALA